MSRKKPPGRKLWARAFLRRLAFGAARFLGVPFLRIVAGTCRADIVGWDGVEAEHERGQAVIFSLWHNRLLLPVWFFRHKNIHVMVSRHGDGELITRILERVGFVAVRGSAERSHRKIKKGGARALAVMARSGRSGRDLAFTPDGPKGPIYSIAPGLLTLARLAQLKVVPVGIEVSRSWRLRSWDRFRIPKPFSRAHVVFGAPLALSPDDEEAHAQLAEAMKNVTHEAAAEIGVENPFADGDPDRVGELKKGPRDPGTQGRRQPGKSGNEGMRE